MAKNYTKLKYHIFFGTRHKPTLLSPDHRRRAPGFFHKILEGSGGTLVAGGGTADHIHLLMGLRPSHAISEIVGSLKAASSAWLKKLVHGFAWQRGYVALSVSEQESHRVERFIRRQEEYHRATTFEEERHKFLDLHEIDVDDGALYPQATHTWLRHHVLFSTKNRLELISPDLENEVYAVINEKIQQLGGDLIEIGGMPDHLHVLVATRPKHTMVDVIHDIKGSSSRWLNQHGGQDFPFAWQAGYSAFSVSKSQEDVVRRYIRNQKEHHRRVSTADELKALIQQHNPRRRATPG